MYACACAFGGRCAEESSCSSSSNNEQRKMCVAVNGRDVFIVVIAIVIVVWCNDGNIMCVYVVECCQLQYVNCSFLECVLL
jgi:hypothetical protein